MSEEAAVPAGEEQRPAEAQKTQAEPPAKAPKTKKKAPKAPAPTVPGVTPLPAKVAYPLAIACGVLYFLAFPGIDVWPLSFVALVPLIVALRGQTARRALGLGWLAGFTMTMVGFYWLLEMLKVFSGFPTPLCLVFMAILCGYQAGRIALCGWLYGRAEARGWPAGPVFALAFVASELCYPLLFPWYYGATVHNAPVLMQTADLGGPYLVGLVLVAANLALAELILARREKRPLNRRLLLAGAIAPALGALYGFVRMRSVDTAAAVAPEVKVGMVQGNQPLLGRNDALRVHFNRTAELRKAGVDLVVWSEGASSQVQLETPELDQVRHDITNRLHIPTIIGTLLARPAKNPRPNKPGHGHDDYDYFNTAIIADKAGAIHGRYDKQYLLAFGEYLPLSETFPVLKEWSPNSSSFSSGTSIEALPMDDHKITAMICYEDILPGFVNGMVRHADPDLLVNLTNDAWFGDSTEPFIHLALAKMRAVEHHRYLVRVTNSGVSALVDPVGRVVVHGGTFKEEVIIGVAKWMRSTNLYELLGDWPWYLASVIIAAMAFVPRSRVFKRSASS